ncbi:Enamine deaminase RidA, house cleaning of reactive enamine intermediates, YjgF/YER057c/UK114 family [Streptomyces sp. DvalAA-14]|uniref:RidA family protein n=1 Tax=unclassified Streptomyces TaxID=2593676 RepID=UPI00081B6FF0|nr:MULTISPECIES: RidA family protein [unclassified Streptomyces]MYS24011.1 RidA family protein [Streptomyces sp. SID4948]SCE41513.1 Enamine deaminase RidA, house cleaning of reactive enamine intermediates, YjgF/YER057c/UK114 family [Streptomyces sp. DvalAA-14]
MAIHRNPVTVHQPVAGYDHQIEVENPARWLVLSGQIGMRLDGTVDEEPIEQLRVALDNLGLNLEAAGLGVRDLVKLTFILVGDIDPGRRRDTVDGWLGGHRPCTTLFYATGLATPTLRVEIDAWAAAPAAG